MTAATKPLLSATEAEFQNLIIEYAQIRGWLVMHTRPARTERGWRTPLQGDAGYPDLTMARRGRLVIAELKSESGKVTREQAAWLEHLPPRVAQEDDSADRDIHSHAIEVYVWRPRDWERIKEVLA